MTRAVKKSHPVRQEQSDKNVVYQGFLTIDAQNHEMKVIRKNTAGYQ